MEADALVLVMDGQQGLTSSDREVVSWLRKTHPNKPLLLAVNKCENPQKADIQVCLCIQGLVEVLCPWPCAFNL